MSLRTVFRSRKFSRSFNTVRAVEEDDRKDRLAGDDDSPESPPYGRAWSTMLPELLGEIIRRVDDTEDQWPNRQNVVACACVCKRWREITQEIVRSTTRNGGGITFPYCLKQVFYYLCVRSLFHEAVVVLWDSF